MIKLYHAAMTSSHRCRWALEEAGIPYEIERISLGGGDHKRPEYLAVHPLGSVPALVDDEGRALIESAAICMHVAELDPSRQLVPADGSRARALYYQWILFAMTNLDGVIHPVYLRMLRMPPEHHRSAATDDERAALRRQLSAIGPSIADAWLLGDSFSAADVVVGGLLEWAYACGLLQGAGAAESYHARLRARPAFQRAFAD
jgi:glutathione S-transferase